MGVFDLGPPAGGGGDIDRDEVRRALLLLADPAHGVELTALPSGRKLYGAGDDPDALADLAAQLVGGSGVYLVVNPVPPGLGRGAKAAEVVYYRWLFLDIDAIKAAGHEDGPATDEECAAAGRLAFTIQSYLMAKGWPAPLVVTSGNGRYLLFRLELPNDKQTRALVAACVRALAKKYDGADGKVDRAVHNANRLMRLPGMVNRKGAASPERPHRPCKIESVPAETRCVTLRQLQELAGVVQDAPKAAPAAERRTPPLAVANDPRRLAYLKVVAEAELGVIAGAPKGERNKLLNKAAYSLYRYAHGGEWSRAELDPLIRDAARASGLYDDPGCGERGVEATMNSAYTAATEKPKTVPPPSHEPGPRVEIGGAKAKKQAEQEEKQAASKAERRAGKPVIVFASEVVPKRVEWLWPSRVPLGKLVTFAGLGGLGKSFVILDMSARISRGDVWPEPGGECAPEGKVLYISGEDAMNDTLVPRLTEMNARLDRVAFIHPDWLTDFSMIDLEALDLALDAAGDDVRMVAIDPPTCWLPPGIDDHKNAELRRVLTPLAAWAERRNVAVILNTHLNKGGAGKVEAQMRVMGSAAWVNAVRAAHLFTPNPDDETQVLFVPMKMNLGPKRKALAYEITPSGDQQAKVTWHGEVDLTANQALAGGSRPRAVVATEWIVERFAEKREWPSDELFERGHQDGVSKNAIYEAKNKLNLPRARRTVQPNGDAVFFWWVPEGWQPPAAKKKAPPPGQRESWESRDEEAFG